MTLKEKSNGHQKHAFLQKPSMGKFHRNEWAILGTPCGRIKKLAFAITEKLSHQLNIGYVDADHKSADEEADQGRDPRSALGHGGNLEFTDKITFGRFDLDRELNEFEMKPYFDAQDMVVVNGNHFQASRQIVVIDPKKSLEKRIDQLTNVVLILTTEDDQELPEILTSKIDVSGIPVIDFNDYEAVAQFLFKSWEENIPKLRGMVLAGGRSVRMGQDKGKINYHGQDQRIHMWELLNQVCDDAVISIRPEQEQELSDYPTLADSFTDLGPFGAILSAFRQDPDAAWMVVACDQPYLGEEELEHLKDHRNLSKVATCYHNSETNFPEPLITIWEPRAYKTLLHFLSLGYSCPRKALINSDCEVLQTPNDLMLKNVNTPEEYARMSKV